MKVLLLSKDRQDPYIEKVVAFIQEHFAESQIVLAKPNELMPESLCDWQGDLIISYLCPWILPESILSAAKKAAINFHPATPDYPGTGCTNFAIYDEVNEYGATCHHMVGGVDSGEVIAVKYFPVGKDESVYEVTQNCYREMFALFLEVMQSYILVEKPLPVSLHQWTRVPYCKKDLEALKKLNAQMDADEIKRRVRATTYPGYQGAYFDLNGLVFEYKDPNF